MSESRRVLVRDDEGCSQIVPLNRKKSLFSQQDVGSCDPSAPFGITSGPSGPSGPTFKRPEPVPKTNGSSIIDYSMIRAIVREEVRSILREELSKMFENYKK